MKIRFAAKSTACNLKLNTAHLQKSAWNESRAVTHVHATIGGAKGQYSVEFSSIFFRRIPLTGGKCAGSAGGAGGATEPSANTHKRTRCTPSPHLRAFARRNTLPERTRRLLR